MRLFISKNREDCLPFLSWCETQSIEVISNSLISFSPVEFVVNHPYAVVFFASIRAFDFFRRSHELSDSVKIAAAGESTKKYIESKGYQVDFCPTRAGNVQESALEFTRWLHALKTAELPRVLFPSSNRTQKSYSQFLDSNQFETVTVYQTVLTNCVIPPVEVYVFTSPSNVEAFFVSNSGFPEHSKIIAWGASTRKALADFPNVDQLELSSYTDLQEKVSMLL